MPGATSSPSSERLGPSASSTSRVTASITSGRASPSRATTARVTCCTICGDGPELASRAMVTLRACACSSASGVTIASGSTVSVAPGAIASTSAWLTTLGIGRLIPYVARMRILMALLVSLPAFAEEREQPAGTDPFPAEVYRARRDRLASLLKKGVALVLSANGDELEREGHQSPDFAY